MGNKQQGVVDWLLEQFDRNKIVMHNELGERTKVFTLINNDIVDQAKEMEKERMIQFAKKCLDKALDLDLRTTYSQVEQHYNETYGGGEQ